MKKLKKKRETLKGSEEGERERRETKRDRK